MVRHGSRARAVLAAALLLGGVVLWLAVDDAPRPWRKAASSKPSLAQGLTSADKPSAPAGAVAAQAPVAPDTTASPAPKPIAVTDFFQGPMDEPVAGAYARLRAGERLSADTVKALMAYDETHADDPRVQLLFAYDSMQLEWKRAAIGHYLQAYRMDARAREDARMLSDLITLAVDATESQRAADAVMEIYGIDALPGVQDALADAEQEGRTDAIALLSTLRDRLKR